MANPGLAYALAGAFAIAHAGGCSPTPATDQTVASASEQTNTVASAPQQQAQAPAATDPIVSPASAGSSNISFEDASLSFAAVFPDAPANDPIIADLRREAESYLAQLKTNARADFERMKKAGFEPRPWDVRIRWKYTARAGDI